MCCVAGANESEVNMTACFLYGTAAAVYRYCTKHLVTTVTQEQARLYDNINGQLYWHGDYQATYNTGRIHDDFSFLSQSRYLTVKKKNIFN